MPLTTDARLEALEAAVARIETGMAEVAKATAEAEEHAEQRATAAAKLVTDQFVAANASILAVSTTLNTLQNRVGTWAAGGSLLGAVLLFIAVRALGL